MLICDFPTTCCSCHANRRFFFQKNTTMLTASTFKILTRNALCVTAVQFSTAQLSTVWIPQCSEAVLFFHYELERSFAHQPRAIFDFFSDQGLGTRCFSEPTCLASGATKPWKITELRLFYRCSHLLLCSLTHSV